MFVCRFHVIRLDTDTRCNRFVVICEKKNKKKRVYDKLQTIVVLFNLNWIIVLYILLK